jgi:hypothetical protein
MKSAYSVFVRIFEGRRPPGRSRHTWEDNIKIHLAIRMGGCDLDSSGSC